MIDLDELRGIISIAGPKGDRGPQGIPGPKGDKYTLTEEDIAEIASKVDGLKMTLVDELPEIGESKVIYLLRKEGSENDSYDEYLYVDDKWEIIGTTKIDLSQYYTKEEVTQLISDNENLVEVTYGTSTFNDIKNLVSSGKVPYLVYGNDVILVSDVSSNYIKFLKYYYDLTYGTNYVMGVYVSNSNRWSNFTPRPIQTKLTAGTNITIEDNVISATGGVDEEVVNQLIDNRARYYDFVVNEENTELGLRVVRDLWADNFKRYDLAFNGEPVHKATKVNDRLVMTVLRVDYTNPAGPQLVGRVIIPTFENDEIVGYTVSSSSAGVNYTVGHTDDQINEMIDERAKGLPETPAENGNYSLVATVKNGEVEFAWKSISGVWQLPTQINNDLKLFQAATINQVNNALEVY